MAFLLALNLDVVWPIEPDEPFTAAVVPKKLVTEDCIAPHLAQLSM